MDRVSIIEEIRRNDRLLSLPQVLSKVLEEVGKEDFSSEELAKIILKDPPLTGRILRLANSSFYHQMSKIKTVHQAINIMGMTTVKCLALSTSVFQPSRVANASGVDPKAFFSYVLSVAGASEKIARLVGHRSPEEAFIAGLLHDIGVLYLLHHYPKEYRKITTGQIKASSLSEAEKKVFEIDHCEVGRYIATTWRLPEYIIESIAGHHSYHGSKSETILQNCVRLAVVLSNDEFSGFKGSIEQRINARKILADLLGLSDEDVDEVSGTILSVTIDAAGYLDIDIGDIDEILISANREIWKSYLTIENLFKERQELSRQLLLQEREKGAMESRNVAMATLSHYLNNAVMAAYGRSQIMRRQLALGETEKLLEQMPHNLDAIDDTVKKVVAVLKEMQEISPIDQERFLDMFNSLDIDDLIEKRLNQMASEDKWKAPSEPVAS